MNLRLQPEAEAALRAEAERSGRSQQEILRAAVDRYLGLSSATEPTSAEAVLVASGLTRPPRTPYRKVQPRLSLPPGVTTMDLLDRDDRI